MATIKAECSSCGVVRLRAHDLTVRVCVEDESLAAYRFRCPRCDNAVIHNASAAICALLVSVGVEEETWHLPAEFNEEHVGPALTTDDLLDFHLALQRDDWASHLGAPTTEPSPNTRS